MGRLFVGQQTGMSTHRKSELLSAIWVDDEIYHKIRVDVEKKISDNFEAILW